MKFFLILAWYTALVAQQSGVCVVILRFIMHHTFSMGDRSGLQAAQSSTWTLLLRGHTVGTRPQCVLTSSVVGVQPCPYMQRFLHIHPYLWMTLEDAPLIPNHDTVTCYRCCWTFSLLLILCSFCPIFLEHQMHIYKIQSSSSVWTLNMFCHCTL